MNDTVTVIALENLTNEFRFQYRYTLREQIFDFWGTAYSKVIADTPEFPAVRHASALDHLDQAHPGDPINTRLTRITSLLPHTARLSFTEADVGGGVRKRLDRISAPA